MDEAKIYRLYWNDEPDHIIIAPSGHKGQWIKVVESLDSPPEASLINKPLFDEYLNKADWVETFKPTSCEGA